MTDLHITSSLSTAGGLSRVVRMQLLTGETFAINDIPGIGPLDDGKRRMDFLHGLSFKKSGVNWSGSIDTFSRWRLLLVHLREKPVDRLLRECDENGVLQFRELSAHDDHLLSFCSRRWMTAVRLIGQAMGHSDPRNNLGDVFLSSRLEHLIVSGRIEADGPRTSIRDFRVRLTGK